EGDGWPAAWLSLDENDNHFPRFFTYFIAAAQTVYPRAAQGLMAGLQSGPPDDKAIVPALLHELVELNRPLLVVLDDYHVITNQAIHQALGRLIDAMPPTLRLLITSREEPPLPLPRWRVRDQLTEIGAADLRFTSEEAAAFLSQTMGLALDETAVAALEERTEGWVAGLQLAALSLRGDGDSERFIAEFGGSDRHVADYLLEEVLYRQPEDVQRFLLQTSILERFCAALCDATVTADGRPPGVAAGEIGPLVTIGESQQILEYLEANNLFLIPLDGQRRWHRYHHLFAELLQDRLARDYSQAQIDQLHLRASVWFAAQGLTEEAINHAIQGQDFDQAARLITTLPSDSLWDQGNASLLKHWQELIPTGSLLRHPRSLISIAAAHLITGNAPPVYKLLALCEGIESIYGEYALLKCTLVRNEGDFRQALHLAQEAGEFLPEKEQTMRAMALMQIVNNLLRLGDLAGAERAARQARALVDRSGEVSPNTHLQVIQLQGIVSLFRADFIGAQRLFHEGLVLAERMPGGTPPMVGMIHAELGRVHYEWNELTQAKAHFNEAQSWAERTGISDIRVAVVVGEIQLACQRGDAAAAEPYLLELAQFASHSRLQDMVSQAESLVALYRLRLGMLDEAIRWANASGLKLTDRPDPTQRLNYLVLTAVRLAEVRALGLQDSLTEMSTLLQHMFQQAAAGHYRHDMIELLVLQALVLDYGGNNAAARQALKNALDLAQPGSLVRTFLDAGPALAPLLAQMEGPYALSLYRAFRQEPRAQNDDKSAAAMLNLTPREVEILQEIVAGLSNKEIEEKLVISRNTVRTHIKNLYSKLEVSSRTQAIKKARELQLL
ncbi:MAG: LuxR C-terminal-related transcriptional regulator, partial [Candidatus Promineifilaceae bacterium]